MTEQAPALTLTAVVSKRNITVNAGTGPTLLLLFDQGTSTTLDPVLGPVRELWPAAEMVQIVNVVDLRKFPKVVRKIAEGLMANNYKENAKGVPADRDPADYIIILPDWDAKVMKALGIESVSKELALAVIAPGGALVGSYQGDGAGERAVELLRLAGATRERGRTTAHNP